MKNTRFISIFLTTALIVSVFGFSAYAQSTPGVTTGSVILQSNRSGFMYGSINPNGSSTYARAEIGTTSSFGRVYGPSWVGSGTSPVDIQFGFINLQENSTYYYRIVAQTGNSVVTGETRTFVTNLNGGSSANTNNNYNNSTNNNSSNSGSTSGVPTVFTNGPASVLSNSAVINGTINPNNSSTTFWFEFDTTTSLGQMTSVQALGSGNSGLLVTGNLSNLQSGTTYYYRVAAQNNYGTNRGSILSFTTQGSQTGGQVLGSASGNGNNGATVSGSGNSTANSTSSSGSVASKTGTKTTSVARTTTPVSDPAKDRPSFISLEYSLGNDGALVLVVDNIKPKPGEEFSYTVVYKNETSTSFNEANLKVILPVQVDYIGSDKEPNNISANIVEFTLGNIAPRTQGTVVVIVKVKEMVESGTNMIFTSVLGYKDSKGTQLANTSYMTVRVGDSGVPLSASLGSFLGTSGMLWLIALALMMVMGLLVFRLVRMKKTSTTKEEDIFGLGKVPATFEPVGQPSSFRP